MTSPLGDARVALAAKLVPLGWRVYATAIEAPAPPCFQIGFGTPWIYHRRLAGRVVDVNLQIRAVVPAVGGNIESLDLLEQMVWAANSVVMVLGETEPPRTDTINQIEVLVADLTVLAQVKE